ncbi:intraflagellar transport protein 81 homolog isoform X2 [Oncorhynchus nerka]|uniref:intraflagellar transport protein 81 homolog isoform X2 n=1 Tax=Oncorhynchus nerka TaxID=8023 RepID=UPI0031B8621C
MASEPDRSSWRSVQESLQQASGRQKRSADRHRSEAPVFVPGDRVWLSTRNLPLRLPCRKLGPQCVGPFKVLRRINEVKELNSTIGEKKSALAPAMKEPRPLRQQRQELTQKYEEKKAKYDSCAAGLESNRSTGPGGESSEGGDNSGGKLIPLHQLHIIELQMQQAADEMKAPDPQERRKTIREQYMKNVAEQESLGKCLIQNHMLAHEKLMMCVLGCFLRAQNQVSIGQVIQEGGEDRLVL